MSGLRPRARRLFLVLALASVALGVAPTGSSCACGGNPLAPGVCHERDPATDHDGQDSAPPCP